MSTLASLLAGAVWLPYLVELAVKATVVLFLAGAVAASLHRSSAALRHTVWLVGIVGVLVLPVVASLVPAWELPVLSAPAADLGPGVVETPGVVTAPPPAAPAPDAGAAASSWLPAAILMAGVLLGLLWMVVGWLGVARLGRRAETVRDPEWLRMEKETAGRLGLRRSVRLLRARSGVMPATWGVARPSVLLPLTADMWPVDRRRAVLAHELAHVKRLDCLTQAVAHLACALFWWHPLVWYAARRLRIERERACDDLVLGTGARASDYATHLLEIARAHRTMRLSGPTLLGMARASQLESRLLRVLDVSADRRAPSTRATAIAIVGALLAVAPLAALRPSVAPAQAQPAASAMPAEEPRADDRAPGDEGGAEAGAGKVAIPLPPQPPAPPAVPVDTPEVGRRGAAGPEEAEIEQIIAMRAVGVTLEYIAEMNQAGFGRLSPDQLVSLRALGVTPAYLAELRRSGINPRSADEAAGLRAVGVTPAYVRDLASVGITGLSGAELIELRVHRVTAAYVRELEAAGFGPLTREQLVRLRVSGVDRELIESRRGVRER